MSEIKRGDRVILYWMQTPFMLVEAVVDGSEEGKEVGIHCAWYNANRELQRAVFAPDMVVRLEGADDLRQASRHWKALTPGEWQG